MHFHISEYKSAFILSGVPLFIIQTVLSFLEGVCAVCLQITCFSIALKMFSFCDGWMEKGLRKNTLVIPGLTEA